MASTQGICKNCGSLIYLNDREELCECLFCDCVFPSAEAIEIAKNPQAYTFPNEKQPKRDGKRKYSEIPVYPDPVPAAVKRAEAMGAVKKEEKSPYEVSPDDIKAPRKTLLAVFGVSAAVIILIVAIAWPLYSSRMQHRDSLSDSISGVFSEFTVNTAEEDGYNVGFYMRGQSNNILAVTTDDEVTDEQVLTTFKNYAELRAKEYGYDQNDFSKCYGDVRLTVYAANGGFSLDNVQTADDLSAGQVAKLS